MAPATASPSFSAQVQGWVEALPEGTPFRISDVPVPADAAKVPLSRLAANPDHSGLKRLLRGVFYKGRRVRDAAGCAGGDGATVWSFVPHDRYLLLMWYVGAVGRGLGYAGLHALHKVGWTDQVPIGMEVAVVGSPPPSPEPGIIAIRGRSNRRRLQLSGAEVSVLEAARFSWFLNDEDLLPYLYRSTRDTPDRPVGGLAGALLVHDYVLRPDALRWAVDGEQCKDADLVKERVMCFAESLPCDLRYQRHWTRGHLLDA